MRSVLSAALAAALLALAALPARAALLGFDFTASPVFETYTAIADPFPGEVVVSVSGRLVIDTLAAPSAVDPIYHPGAVALLVIALHAGDGSVLGRIEGSGGSVRLSKDQILIGVQPVFTPGIGTDGPMVGIGGPEVMNSGYLALRGATSILPAHLADLTSLQVLALVGSMGTSASGVFVHTADAFGPGTTEEHIAAGLTGFQAVPLPGSLPLLAGGLGLLALRRRRG